MTTATSLILRYVPRNGHLLQRTALAGEDILSGSYARREEQAALEMARLQALLVNVEAKVRRRKGIPRDELINLVLCFDHDLISLAFS